MAIGSEVCSRNVREPIWRTVLEYAWRDWVIPRPTRDITTNHVGQSDRNISISRQPHPNAMVQEYILPCRPKSNNSLEFMDLNFHLFSPGHRRVWRQPTSRFPTTVFNYPIELLHPDSHLGADAATLRYSVVFLRPSKDSRTRPQPFTSTPFVNHLRLHHKMPHNLIFYHSVFIQNYWM